MNHNSIEILRCWLLFIFVFAAGMGLIAAGFQGSPCSKESSMAFRIMVLCMLICALCGRIAQVYCK